MRKGCVLTSPVPGAFSTNSPPHGVHLGNQTHPTYMCGRLCLTGSIRMSERSVLNSLLPRKEAI